MGSTKVAFVGVHFPVWCDQKKRKEKEMMMNVEWGGVCCVVSFCGTVMREEDIAEHGHGNHIQNQRHF